MLTDEMKTRLTAQSLVPSGYTVTRGKMPATPDKIICLEETGGAGPVAFLSGSTSMEQPALQVRVRGATADYDGPRLVINAIFRAVTDWGAFTVSGVRYAGLQPLQSPYKMNEDGNGRVEFVVNFLVMKAMSTT